MFYINTSINPLDLHKLTPYTKKSQGDLYMKATGIVRRIDDLGRVVIPKEIRRTMRIREGDPSLITLTWYKALVEVAKGRDKG